MVVSCLASVIKENISTSIDSIIVSLECKVSGKENKEVSHKTSITILFSLKLFSSPESLCRFLILIIHIS